MKKILFLITATLSAKCPDLMTASFGSDIKIESATFVPGVPNLPEHCDVRGTIWPEAKFALKMPTAWNHRFEMVGNGGTAGVISFAAVDLGVRKGFAAVSTDTGHDAAKEVLAAFGQPRPDNPNAERKVIDFGYLSVHETAVLAKKIIKAYYGEPPSHSYWVGCSTGGRQGLMEAQRYPEDFDGLVTGAPALNASGLSIRRIWGAQAQMDGGAIAVEKLPMLAHAVYEKCDAVDGLRDGLIDDPRKCGFDPARDLPQCAAGKDGPNCFTAAQTGALKKIYGGPRNSSGKLIVPGQPLGAEIAVQGKSGWEENLVGPSKLTLPRAESYMRFIYLDPLPPATWTYADFNFDTDPPRMAKAEAKINATNSDLRPLKQRGGKILQYHGWADPLIPAYLSINYYESVVEKIGGKETRDFYRLFMMPGVFHCSGGVGCGTVDWVTPIVDWVEKGTAPERLVGSLVVSGETKRTRPFCPYPQVAKYKGSGSIDDAANFTCAAR